LLSPKRDLIAAKLFLRLALSSGGAIAAGDQCWTALRHIPGRSTS